jgi:hypothetical protein
MSETYIISTTDGKSSEFHTPSVEEFLYSLDKALADPSVPLPHAYMDTPDGVEWAVHFNPDNITAVSVATRGRSGAAPA